MFGLVDERVEEWGGVRGWCRKLRAPDVPADDMRRNELSDFNASEA